MEIFCRFASSCITDCLPSCISEAVSSDFERTSPLWDRCDLYWRDNVMLVGLVLDIIALAYAIFIGSVFFICVTVVLAIIILFAMYYVSRYAEQRAMEVQINDLTQNVRTLTGNTEEQTRITRLAQSQLETLETQNRQLASTAQDLTGQLENLREADKRLANAEIQLQSVVGQVKMATDQLTSLMEQDRVLRENIKKETDRLIAIERKFAGHVDRLGTVSERLEHNTQRQSLVLNAALERL